MTENKGKLKNKNKVFTKATSLLLIGSGILTITGLGGFVYFNKKYAGVQNEINNKVAEVTATQEYASYKEEQEKIFYEMYKNGEITSDEFEEKISNLNTIDYIIKNNVPASEEDKIELENLDNENMSNSIGALASTVVFAGCNAVTLAGLTALLDKKDEEKEM